jgi:hypothetical protein
MGTATNQNRPRQPLLNLVFSVPCVGPWSRACQRKLGASESHYHQPVAAANRDRNSPLGHSGAMPLEGMWLGSDSYFYSVCLGIRHAQVQVKKLKQHLFRNVFMTNAIA